MYTVKIVVSFSCFKFEKIFPPSLKRCEIQPQNSHFWWEDLGTIKVTVNKASETPKREYFLTYSREV